MDKKYYTERIKWVRDCKNITQVQVARYLKLKPQQYSRYENGINVMPVTYLAQICAFLDVSADYILGLTDEMISFKKEIKVKQK